MNIEKGILDFPTNKESLAFCIKSVKHKSPVVKGDADKWVKNEY
ncbi:MAG: hypothetical protein SOZ70_02875 [Bacilli bacterium]|nr:hypothetical protein [Bacilli bacterium]